MNVRQEVIASGWRDLGVITTADVAWATTEFAKAIVEALTSTVCLTAEIPYGAANIEMRFYGTASDGDDVVLNIYGKREDDGYYQLLATLTMVHGTAQKGAATELWVDTITETKDFMPGTSGGVLSPADNTIARFYFKPGGFKQLAIIATTLDGTDVGIEMASYSG